MLLGANFDKISTDFLGFEILEPNALISDTIMAIVSIVLAYKMRELRTLSNFSKLWFWFFLIYGLSSFMGGLSHAFFNYWGISGKIFTWITAIVSVLLIELAMITLYLDLSKARLLKNIALAKTILVALTVLFICLLFPVKDSPEIVFTPIAINTIIGLILSTGILGFRYTRFRNSHYKYFYKGVFIMLPSTFFFLGQINIHPWFDKNDVSHYLMTVGIIFFYFGVIKTIHDHSLVQEIN